MHLEGVHRQSLDGLHASEVHESWLVQGGKRPRGNWGNSRYILARTLQFLGGRRVEPTGLAGLSERDRIASLFFELGRDSHAISCSVANESQHRVRDHQLRLVLSDFSPPRRSQNPQNPQSRQDPRRSMSLSGFIVLVAMGPSGEGSFSPRLSSAGRKRNSEKNWVWRFPERKYL